MQSKVIIIINPTKLHERFCQACIEQKINIIALYTFDLVHAYYLLDTKYFIAVKRMTRQLSDDLDTIKGLLPAHELLAVLPGVESDLAYAEQIAYALLPLKSNHQNSSDLRYKKFEMNEKLKTAGLNYIPQIRVPLHGPLPGVIPLKFPLVIKPSFQSGGSVGVKVCNALDEVQQHLSTLQQSTDPYGKKLEADIIMQEKIEGVEYFADSVTFNGEHLITSIFKYEKVNLSGSLIYRYIDYVRPADKTWSIGHDYMQKVLNVLDVKHGFAHTEFIITKDDRPYLIELNPRLSGLGGTINFVCKLINGYDASDVYLHFLQNPSALQKMHDLQTFKLQNKYARIVCLFAWEKIKFTGFNAKILVDLKSSQRAFHTFKPEGALIMPPIDLLDIVVVVMLVDESIDKINADTEYLQYLEHKGALFND